MSITPVSAVTSSYATFLSAKKSQHGRCGSHIRACLGFLLFKFPERAIAQRRMNAAKKDRHRADGDVFTTVASAPVAIPCKTYERYFDTVEMWRCQELASFAFCK